MLVYRLEDADGNGPSCYGLWGDWDADAHDDGIHSGDWTHHQAADYPSPWEEDIPTYHNGLKLYCGFSRLSNFLHWWTHRMLDRAVREGLLLSTYEVPDIWVFEGRRQVTFARDLGTLIERRDPREVRASLTLPVPLAA